MKQVFIGGYYHNIFNNQTGYNHLLGGRGWATSTLETTRRQCMPSIGIIDSLIVHLIDAPGTSKSWTFTVRINGEDTALTCTISDDETTGSDVAHSVAYSAGDTVTLKCTPSSSPTRTYIKWSVLNDGTAVLLGSQGYTTVDGSYYTFPTTPGTVGWGATEADERILVPVAGTINNLYVNIDTAPGSGKSRTFTLYKNGVITGLTVTIADTDTTANDTTHSVSVSKGDFLSFEMVNSGSPAVSLSPQVCWGMNFQASTWTYAPIMMLQGTPAYNPQYYYVSTQGGADSIEKNQQLIQSCTIEGLFVSQKDACGSGKSRTFTVYKGSNATALTVTLSGADTYEEIAESASFDDGDLVSIKVEESGTPDGSILRISLDGVAAEPAAATIRELWVEDEYLRYGDGLGWRRQFEGFDTGGAGTAGEIGRSGTILSYNSATGKIREVELQDRGLTATAGEIGGEDAGTRLRFTDSSNYDREGEGMLG